MSERKLTDKDECKPLQNVYIEGSSDRGIRLLRQIQSVDDGTAFLSAEEFFEKHKDLLTDEDFAKKYLNPNRVIRKSSDYPDTMSFMEAINPNMTDEERAFIQREIDYHNNNRKQKALVIDEELFNKRQAHYLSVNSPSKRISRSDFEDFQDFVAYIKSSFKP